MMSKNGLIDSPRNVKRMKIDLKDSIPGADNFYWYEVLKLRTWGFHCHPNIVQYNNMLKLIKKMEIIRKFFGRPINVNSGVRPVVYNKLIGGSIGSAHIDGEALDFSIKDLTADHVRLMLIAKLDELDIRMENLPGSKWIHIDLKPPGITGRFFIPYFRPKR